MTNTQAVIDIAGHQHLVSEGDVITIDQHLDTPVGKTFSTDKVLMIIQEGKALVGTPFVKEASITFKVKESGRGKKIDISRFKAKSRYRRKAGHRQPQTQLSVAKISLK